MRQSLFTLLIVSLLGLNAVAQEGRPTRPDEPMIVLTGAVYDENGAVIVNGTKITARGHDGRVYATRVNDEGVYTLWLALGVYQLEVEASHFCPSKVERFRAVNATHGKMSLDFVLDVASSHLPCARKPSPDEGPRGEDGKKSETIH